MKNNVRYVLVEVPVVEEKEKSGVGRFIAYLLFFAFLLVCVMGAGK